MSVIALETLWTVVMPSGPERVMVAIGEGLSKSQANGALSDEKPRSGIRTS